MLPVYIISGQNTKTTKRNWTPEILHSVVIHISVSSPDQLHNAFVRSGLILGLHSANERRHYKVTPSLIGRAQTQNQPCVLYSKKIKQKQMEQKPMWVYGLYVCYTKNNKRNKVQVVITSDMLIYYHFVNTFNSLGPRCTIRWQRYGSSLVWVIIDSGNGLLSDSTKPLPVPVLTNWGFTGSCWGQPHRNSLTELSLKIINSR